MTVTDGTHEVEENAALGQSDSTALVMLQTLRDMTKVQCSDGNWNYDPYMHGMANGMIFALSIFEGGCPEYLQAPEQWLKDLPDTELKVHECVSDAYDLGRQAYLRGDDISLNPYCESDAQHDEWDDGYGCAEKDDIETGDAG